MSIQPQDPGGTIRYRHHQGARRIGAAVAALAGAGLGAAYWAEPFEVVPGYILPMLWLTLAGTLTAGGIGMLLWRSETVVDTQGREIRARWGMLVPVTRERVPFDHVRSVTLTSSEVWRGHDVYDVSLTCLSEGNGFGGLDPELAEAAGPAAMSIMPGMSQPLHVFSTRDRETAAAEARRLSGLFGANLEASGLASLGAGSGHN
jgi:hypothetical protein